MRKRFFFPVFTLFVFFPLIIYFLSYTRFFNDEVRRILISVVDDGTNARLRLGVIHGSVFGSFRIDGAALLYRGEPIAMADTIRISHLPLSLVTRTIQATRVELVKPRFYLVRSKDGTFNVDHIGKPGGAPGGKFNWTVLANSVKILDGEFLLYDSTVSRSLGNSGKSAVKRFDATDFRVKNLDLSASASLSGDNLSVNIDDMSLRVDPPGMRVDSMRFGFFTSPGGTEVNGFRLKTGRTILHVDLTLAGQDLLDTLNGSTIRNKYFTASVDAANADLNQIGEFVKLPVNYQPGFNLSFFASGTLDTLNVKQCFLKTDSSIVPVSASFRNILDSTLTMNVTAQNAEVDMAELSTILKNIGVPDLARLRKMNLTASVTGSPRDLAVSLKLSNEKTFVSAESRLGSGGYNGGVTFRGLDLGEVLDVNDFNTGLNGAAEFSLTGKGGSIPDGMISLSMDSSVYDLTSITHALVKVTSAADSVGADFNILTSRGNIDGVAGLNTTDQAYSADMRFSELDIAPLAHLSNLESDLTGRLKVDGRGFNPDSLRTQLSLLTERSSVGNLRLDNTAFTVELNTQHTGKELRISSPYFDANVSGNFVPHELPGQLKTMFTELADSFSSKVTGKIDSSRPEPAALPKFDADVDVHIKDAALLGQLLGNAELRGNATTHIQLAASGDSVSMSGFLSSDTMNYVQDSLNLYGGRINIGFNFDSDPGLSVWNSGTWSTQGSVGSFNIGSTRLAAKEFRLNYTPGDSMQSPKLAVRFLGQVDTIVDFGIDASAGVAGNEFDFVADSLSGNFYGVPLMGQLPVYIKYSPEEFDISPATFLASLEREDTSSPSEVSVGGSYSLRTGADLHFLFKNFGLRSLQKIARLDTTTLKLKGRVNGRADLNNANNATLLSVDFRGNNVYYNGAIARLIKGKIGLNGQVMSIAADLSKEEDSASYALRLSGTIPLSSGTTAGMHLDLSADSLDVSFLTPFLSGIDDFGGVLSGNMEVSGRYSSPEMKGKLVVNDGRIRLAANEVNYLYDGTIIGEGDKLSLSQMVVRNVPGQTGGTLTANGSITIGENTIRRFNLSFDGSLLVLNAPARRTLHGIYGSAIVGAGSKGLRLEGSLARPMLLGSVDIESADLTLLPLQRKENLASQEIIYRFPPLFPKASSAKSNTESAVVSQPVSSGSLIDSLRYDVEVETKDNVSLRMIFDPTTNEELDAVLGGRLRLSNLTGKLELTGIVNIPSNSNSYYNFYTRHFSATGKLSFTGDPLNPIMDITAQYQGELVDTSGTTSTGKTESVVVQLGISGTFDRPNAPDISMTVDGVPYQGDVQTNAISFILTNQFADALTSPVKRSVADNLWSQAGPGILSAGTSILSGALTNLFSREFSFIRSAELRYSSISDLANPDVAITTQFGRATIRLGGQVTQVASDINNTDISVDYPLTSLLGNMLYLQLSHKLALNSTYFQRETVNALRLFYQLSF